MIYFTSLFFVALNYHRHAQTIKLQFTNFLHPFLEFQANETEKEDASKQGI